MSDTSHIPQSDLYAFKHDLLTQKDAEAFLEHICTCNYCADQFASMMSEDLMEAPKEMKENILRATRRPEVQLEVRLKKTSRRMQLFLYSLKVTAATAAALLILIFTMRYTDMTPDLTKPDHIITSAVEAKQGNYVPITAVIRDNLDTLNKSILNFSNNIMNMEVINNDQKKE